MIDIARLYEIPSSLWRSWYLLNDDGSIRQAESMDDIEAHFQSAKRIISQLSRWGVMVSTVFLGLDHNYYGGGPPILFETMVFGGPLDMEQERYSTLDEARAGHAKWLQRVIEHPRTPKIRKRTRVTTGAGRSARNIAKRNKRIKWEERRSRLWLLNSLCDLCHKFMARPGDTVCNQCAECLE